MIAAFYSKGGRGRPPRGIEMMLRMYLLRCRFNLSDEGAEEAIYDSYAMRRFMCPDFSGEQVPDAAILLKFRHLLEKHNIGEGFFNHIRGALNGSGLMMRGGTIVDAAPINAPGSTGNERKERDSEMKQTKKGNRRYFGLKHHTGADAESGYARSFEVTGANEPDITEAHKLIRADDRVLYGDAGYTGLDKREETVRDEHLSKVDYRINRRRSTLQKAAGGFLNAERDMEWRKSSVRSKAEHVFLTVKREFGYRKTVYRGLFKNRHRL
ncbi:MAG: IS5 family transposase, partial [Deferribacteraceae bacterium]|nr:IS5 family transposase [Deferribacteraceae bacterium]